jgi:hypothetical protein
MTDSDLSGDRTMTDSDFSPTDAAGLAAWFAQAEANAAGLRRRLGELGEDRQDPAPESPAAGAGSWSCEREDRQERHRPGAVS